MITALFIVLIGSWWFGPLIVFAAWAATREQCRQERREKAEREEVWL
jgi:hypothetical protein